MGTFVQTYNLLRPGSGFLAMDGFFISERNDSDMSGIDYNQRMIRLFADTKARYLYRYYFDTRSLSHLILQRPDDAKCHLPMKYVGVRIVEWGWQIGSECTTVFDRNPQSHDHEETTCLKKVQELAYEREGEYREREYYVQGNKELYEQLKRDHALTSGGWVPFLARELPKSQPPLHVSVQSGNLEAVQIALDAGYDINESDVSGTTPIHLAIMGGHYEIFELLLQKKADLELPDGLGAKALHLAAQFDTDGKFIRKLLELGLPVNDRADVGFAGRAPLYYAYIGSNLVGMELLLDAGADTEYYEYYFEKPEFASLRTHPALKKENTTSG